MKKILSFLACLASLAAASQSWEWVNTARVMNMKILSSTVDMHEKKNESCNPNKRQAH